MEKQMLIDQLKAENYTEESALSKVDKAIIYKMFKYIYTFPIDLYEAERMRKDVVGMAQEAEHRGESLNVIIGKDYKRFCEELFFAQEGVEVPKGRRYLRIAGMYYELMGWFVCINASLGAIELLIEVSRRSGMLGVLKIILTIVIGIIAGTLMIAAGKKAKAYNGDIGKAHDCMRWGLGMLALTILQCTYTMVSALQPPKMIHLLYIPVESLVVWIVIAFQLFWAILYIVGARRNQKSS